MMDEDAEDDDANGNDDGDDDDDDDVAGEVTIPLPSLHRYIKQQSHLYLPKSKVASSKLNRINPNVSLSLRRSSASRPADATDTFSCREFSWRRSK